MKLDFLPLDRLAVSKANMRYAKRAPDVSDLLPTVRKRGVIQSLIVRPNCQDGMFEIVAGARRFHAARIVAEERLAADEPLGEAASLPCAILDEGDDADAIEASMIENMARLDADEVSQWEAFVRLVKEGRDAGDIAVTFGLPELTVRRVLALGNLLPRIRDLYRKEAIDAVTVRHLTLASKAQQKAWLALMDDADAYVPTGHQLKAWLFGGQSVKAEHALFDIEASGLATIADLFGEDRYFADSDAFWAAQNAAIETRRAGLIEAGWSDVVIVPPFEHFHTWEYEKAGKRKGGRVYIDVRGTGEVIVHEGYMTRKEARARECDQSVDTAKPARPELSGPLTGYIDLHRHAAVRAALLGNTGVALRLMVAHMIVGSSLWTVRPDPQSSRKEEVRESVETCAAETRFDEHRRAVLAVLGFADDEPTVTGGNGDDHALCQLFHRLLDLPDPVVLDMIAVAMGETLAVGSAAVETLGVQLEVDMADWWEADEVFFELVRDRELAGALLAEIGGEVVAKANTGETAKTVKRIARDHLDGENGRAKVERWVPRWMRFPPSAYTERGGVGSVAAARRAARSEPNGEPDPATNRLAA